MPGKKETRAEKKETFIERVKRLYTEYRRVMVVTIDHVPSSLMAKIRHSLRGKAEVLCGKNVCRSQNFCTNFFIFGSL